jgi:hypothetical protein
MVKRSGTAGELATRSEGSDPGLRLVGQRLESAAMNESSARQPLPRYGQMIINSAVAQQSEARE